MAKKAKQQSKSKGKRKGQTKSSSKKKDDNRIVSFLMASIKWLWLMLIVGLLLGAAIFVMISKTKMPDTEELENPKYEEATMIYATDNIELGRYYSENRELLSFDELNPFIVNALIATEDERFHNHSGIDARGTTRALVYMGKNGGASTITQQLAKLFFTNKSRSFVKRVWQKLQEWVIAVQFEKRYTKEEIISMYLNKSEYKFNSFGIGAAAKTYFGKNQSQLAVEESAVLVGLLKGPTFYDPKRHPERGLRRRNIVLKQMVKNDFLSQSDYDVLKEQPIDLSSFKAQVHYAGSAPYFRTTLTKRLKEIFSDSKYRKPDGTEYNIWEDGLRVYTTIDRKIQDHAEEVARTHMAKIQANFDITWKDKDPWKYTEEKDKAKKERQLKIRKDVLLNERRNSDRYINLRDRIMGTVFSDVLAKFPDARLNNIDIVRMLKEEKEPGYLSRLNGEKIIRKDQAKVYGQILKDPLWKEIKVKRNQLIKKANKDFSTPTKMKIFAYTDSGEKTVTMTPMDSIRYHQEHMQIGSMSMDPRTGYVKSWVGGINNKYYKLDHVKTNRQVGSTFKTLLYATVIAQQGLSPCYKVQDIRHGIPAGDPNFGLMKAWYPENADEKYTGDYLTLKDALLKSKNSISAWLINQLGNVELIRNLGRDLGIPKEKIPPYPSIVLGTPDLTVMEMTGAYSTFANYGIYNEPTFILKIEDRNGKIIYSPVSDQRRVMSEKYNHAVVSLLKHAASAHHQKLSSEFGGKTGTTNDFVDGWFIGISPELVIGTWVGGDNPWIRFRSRRYGYGGTMARPYYLELMKRLEEDPDIKLNKGETFRVPVGDVVETNCALYEQALPSKVESDKAKLEKVLKTSGFEEELEGN